MTQYVKTSTDLETNLVSVERIEEYIKVKTEVCYPNVLV